MAKISGKTGEGENFDLEIDAFSNPADLSITAVGDEGSQIYFKSLDMTSLSSLIEFLQSAERIKREIECTQSYKT